MHRRVMVVVLCVCVCNILLALFTSMFAPSESQNLISNCIHGQRAALSMLSLTLLPLGAEKSVIRHHLILLLFDPSRSLGDLAHKTDHLSQQYVTIA